MKRSFSFLVLVAAIALILFTAFVNKAVSPRFNHVMLYVSDLDASIEFYTEALDVQVTGRVNSITRITDEGENTSPVRMAFLKFPNQDFILELSERSVDKSVKSPFFQHVGIDVLDIEGAAERMSAAGAMNFTGINHLRANDIEVYNCFFTGPDGEQIELMEIIEGEF